MIRIYPDPEALSQAAALLFATTAKQAVKARGRFVVALAGGRTPQRTYQLLAQDPLRAQIPWQQTHVFWGDERWVPADDPRNNARMARQALLDQVPIPAAQLHPMGCNGALQTAAIAYETLLHEFFRTAPPRFDLILLGLGENGHTASLFPGSTVLEEPARWVAELALAEAGEQRLTLTLAAINQARLVVFLVTGSHKASILRQVLEETDTQSLPAQRIHPLAGELLWLVDRDAARLLRSGKELNLQTENL